MDFKKLQSFDWRSLKKYTSSQSFDDLNDFLEKLPQRTNKSMLIILGVIWVVVLFTGLYTKIQLDALTELRVELANAQSLVPIVPSVKNISVNKEEIKTFAADASEVYKGMEVKANGAGVDISAPSTDYFGRFRELVGHVQNGGQGWRVGVNSLCVGRECERQPLHMSLKINKVSVQRPE